MRMTRMTALSPIFAILILSPLSANTFKAFKNSFDERVPKASIEKTLKAFHEKDPSLKSFLEKSVGLVIFPNIGKGGIGLGGAYGKGELRVDGKELGLVSVKQVSYGLQLGGQSFSQLVIFNTEEALKKFKKGSFEFGAQVSAVAADKGAGAEATFNQGIAVFTIAKGGLMYQASVGGQKFSYKAYQK